MSVVVGQLRGPRPGERVDSNCRRENEDERFCSKLCTIIGKESLFFEHLSADSYALTV